MHCMNDPKASLDVPKLKTYLLENPLVDRTKNIRFVTSNKNKRHLIRCRIETKLGQCENRIQPF